jgi:hypothetical protein
VSLPRGDSKRGLVDLILTSPGSLTDTPFDKAQRMGKQDEMSRKLVTIIQKIKGLPGKYKRVLLAWASFANNDGSNIFASKESVAARAGISRWTVYENSDYLEAAGVLLRASSHVCRTEKCNKGGTHFTSQHGQYTAVYRIDVALLQNPTVLLQKFADPTVAKPRKVTVEKSRKGTVAKPDATQALKETPAPLGTKQDSSALTSGSKKESKQMSPPPSAEKKNPTPLGLEIASEEKKNQPQENPHPISEIEEEFWTQEIFTERGELMFAINPKPSVAAIEKGLPICDRILAHFYVEYEGYRGVAATMVLKYNRAHRGHQYATKEDRKLYIRTPEQFFNALESEKAALMNDYLTHDFDNCELCVQAGVFGYRKLIEEMIAEKRQREERKRAEEKRKKEEERLAKLCGNCKERPFGSMTLEGTADRNGRKQAVKVCDACYEAKRKADAEKAAAKQAEAAKPKGDRSPTMCAACHKRPAVGWRYCAECDPANKVRAAAAAASKSSLERLLDEEEL